MKIRITARHEKLSPRVKQYLEEKLERLERYYDRIVDCETVFERVKSSEKVEIKIRVYGTLLVAKASSTDVTKAIDTAIDKLERQLKKFKDKIKSKPHVRMTESLAEVEE
ncbi:MAG: ribosome-associated translation inhibitor RaiA [Bacteroidetes bacterium]|nr:ribosome-associated translation inhibitor RaiA [Bacteroidota bacterium]